MGNPGKVTLRQFTRSYYDQHYSDGLRLRRTTNLPVFAETMRQEAIAFGVRPISLARPEMIQEGLAKFYRWNACTSGAWRSSIPLSESVMHNILNGSILKGSVLPCHLNNIPYSIFGEEIRESITKNVDRILKGDSSPWPLTAFYVTGPVKDLYIGEVGGGQPYNFYGDRKKIVFAGLDLKEGENVFFIPYADVLGLSFSVVRENAEILTKYRLELKEENTYSRHDQDFDSSLNELFLRNNHGFYGKRIRSFFSEIENYIASPRTAGIIPTMKFFLNGPKDHFEFIVPNPSSDQKERRLIPYASVTLGPLSMRNHVKYVFSVHPGDNPDSPGQQTMWIDVYPQHVEGRKRSFFYQPEDMMFVRPKITGAGSQ